MLPPAGLSDERQMKSHVTLKAQLTNSCRRGLVHVMVANFNQEEFVLPNATVVGVAEAISPCVVAEINDSASPRNTPCFTNGKRVNKNRNATAEAKCRDYLDSVLEHRPGTQIRHADALSRAVQTVSRDMEIPRDVVKEAQGDDKFCQSLKPAQRQVNRSSSLIRKVWYSVRGKTENTNWSFR